MKTMFSKHLVAVSLSLALAFSVTNAQDDDKIKLAAKLGYSIQMLRKGELPSDPDMGPLGVVGGLIFHFPVGPVIIAPELLFGYREVGKVEGIEFNEMYLGIIPIMVKFFHIKEKLFLQAGVQVDIPISPEACYEGDCKEHPWREAVGVGIPIGLGYMVASNFAVDFRFTLGLNFMPYATGAMVCHGSRCQNTGALSSLNFGMMFFF